MPLSLSQCTVWYVFVWDIAHKCPIHIFSKMRRFARAALLLRKGVLTLGLSPYQCCYSIVPVVDILVQLDIMKNMDFWQLAMGKYQPGWRSTSSTKIPSAEKSWRRFALTSVTWTAGLRWWTWPNNHMACFILAQELFPWVPEVGTPTHVKFLDDLRFCEVRVFLIIASPRCSVTLSWQKSQPAIFRLGI